MKLSRLVPLVVLLVTVVSLMPPAYATNGGVNDSKSNSFRLACSGTATAAFSATLTLLKDGKQLASAQSTCDAAVQSQARSQPTVVLTPDTPNGYIFKATTIKSGKSNGCERTGPIAPGGTITESYTAPTGETVTLTLTAAA